MIPDLMGKCSSSGLQPLNLVGGNFNRLPELPP
jgi:hypothetical protein